MRKIMFLLMLSLVSFQAFSRNTTGLNKKQVQVLKKINQKLDYIQGSFGAAIKLVSKSKSGSDEELDSVISNSARQKRTFMGFVKRVLTGINVHKYPLVNYRRKLINKLNDLKLSYDKKIKLLNGTDEGILLIQNVENCANGLKRLNQYILNSSAYCIEDESRSFSKLGYLGLYLSNFAIGYFFLIVTFSIINTIMDAGLMIYISYDVFLVLAGLSFFVEPFSCVLGVYDVYKKDPVII
jgi:hypothetical protein